MNNPTIKLEIYHSGDLAQSLCDDFLDNAGGTTANIVLGNGRTDFIVMFENEDAKEKPYFRKGALSAMCKADLEELHYRHYGRFKSYCYDYNKATKAHLIDDLLSVTAEEFYKNEYQPDVNYRDFDDEYVDHESRGDLQDDYVGVIFHEIDEAKQASLSKEIDNVLWRWPVEGMIELLQDGELIDTLYLDDYLDDVYVRNADAVIDQLDKSLKDFPNHDLIMTAVREQLSENLDFC